MKSKNKQIITHFRKHCAGCNHDVVELGAGLYSYQDQFFVTAEIELRDSGITESVIYPDLDGLGRQM